jgi:hypothetical protein
MKKEFTQRRKGAKRISLIAPLRLRVTGFFSVHGTMADAGLPPLRRGGLDRPESFFVPFASSW